MEPTPVIVDFPLRGEWAAAHTPAEKVPSHGTDTLGQRYAYDFIRIEKAGKDFKFFPGSVARYLLIGVRTSDCYGWSEPIYAPFTGTVVSARDGWPERSRLHLLADLAVVLKNSLTFNPKKNRDLRPVLGNHIILQMEGREVFAFLAHARFGSIKVKNGEGIKAGQLIAAVGHSGNSTAPHRHFQLMDKADILKAAGIPCRFKEYEALDNGVWHKVKEEVPLKRQFIRYAG